MQQAHLAHEGGLNMHGLAGLGLNHAVLDACALRHLHLRNDVGKVVALGTDA